MRQPNAQVWRLACSITRASALSLMKVWKKSRRQKDCPPELVQQLLEYRKYQMAAEKLRDIEEWAAKMYARPGNPAPQKENKDKYFDMDLTDLLIVYNALLKRCEKRRRDLREEGQSLELDPYSVDEQISYLCKLLASKTSFSFYEIFGPLTDPHAAGGRTVALGKIITTFLAVLELTKQGMIRVAQKGNFEEIRIFKESITLK